MCIMTTTPTELDPVLAVLAGHAADADAEPVWPVASWDALGRGGVTGWAIPPEYGGRGFDPAGLLDGYGRLAGACLTTCFILSQRDSACRRIRDSGHEALCRQLLPPLARGEAFATVGLSQLTTSRQHVRPVLTVRLDGDAVILDGVMPWVTGAARADHLVTGVVLDDGRQLLLVVPAGTPGLHVRAPLDLMALGGSLTAEVACEGVRVDRRWVLAGPAERVLPAGRGAGSLETSCLALGLAGAAVRYLQGEAGRRPEWEATASSCASRLHDLQGQLRRLAHTGADADAAARLRARANALVLHATQTALAAAKGTGFLRPHPAQRWARQALFFLVWSCPRPALDATLAYLAPPCND
jgi:alkylation response protein AidB-like acyl-CoA dehydrogenase